MSDDRLFASNNAIGRKWYFLNIIILAVITVVTELLFEHYLIPNVKTEIYFYIATFIKYTLFLLYLITFFSLIDRRLYDITGDRRSTKYRNISSIVCLAIFFQITVLVLPHTNFRAPLPLDMMQGIASILDLVFLTIIFFMGFFKGSISNLSYEEYKNKIKYQ